MSKNRNNRFNAVTAYLLGIGITVLICLIGTAGFAKLILDQRLGEGNTRIGVMIILLLAVFAGSQIASNLSGNTGLRATLVVSLGTAVLLLIGGLGMDGAFESAVYNMSAIGTACLASCVICMKKPRKSGARKRRSR